MSEKAPWEPWASAMARAGATDPRNGAPSWTQLAHMADLSVSTVTKAVRRDSRASSTTIQKLAQALRLSPAEIGRWLGQPVQGGPYQPPAEADRLTPRQRKAIDEMIRAIVAADESDTANIRLLQHKTRQRTRKELAAQLADGEVDERPTAARGGESVGRARRAAQDSQVEAPRVRSASCSGSTSATS